MIYAITWKRSHCISSCRWIYYKCKLFAIVAICNSQCKSFVFRLSLTILSARFHRIVMFIHFIDVFQIIHWQYQFNRWVQFKRFQFCSILCRSHKSRNCTKSAVAVYFKQKLKCTKNSGSSKWLINSLFDFLWILSIENQISLILIQFTASKFSEKFAVLCVQMWFLYTLAPFALTFEMHDVVATTGTFALHYPVKRQANII